jgi:hypothetical protein
VIKSGRMFGRYCDGRGVLNLHNLLREDFADIMAAGL